MSTHKCGHDLLGYTTLESAGETGKPWETLNRVTDGKSEIQNGYTWRCGTPRTEGLSVTIIFRLECYT